jgi:hypothetical protein
MNKNVQSNYLVSRFFYNGKELSQKVSVTATEAVFTLALWLLR